MLFVPVILPRRSCAKSVAAGHSITHYFFVIFSFNSCAKSPMLCVPDVLPQAAAFMRQVINEAYAKWTTGFYDWIQSKQNRIPY